MKCGAKRRKDINFSHYNSKLFLQILNAVLEFFLLVALFGVAGIIRAVSPFGYPFDLYDAWRFLPVGVGYASVIVFCYTVTGEYKTIHYSDYLKEIAKVLVVNLLGFVVIASFLYVFNISQFSRILLGYYYVLAVLFLSIKRLLFHKIAVIYTKKHRTKTNVLLIGGENMADEFFHQVLMNQELPAELIGYIAEEKNDNLPNYLGGLNELYNIIKNKVINLIIIALEKQDAGFINEVVMLAEQENMKVCVVPVYNKFISARTNTTFFNGYPLIELKSFETCNIMGVNVAVSDLEKTVSTIERKLETWRGGYICVANVHTTVTAYGDESYLQIQNGAVMVLADGGPLSQYSRNHGYLEAYRVTGPDLLKRILELSPSRKWKHFFYGSTQETLKSLKESIMKDYPGIEIVGMYSPPFRKMTSEEDKDIIAQINDAKPDFLWVGLGAPKQEEWMAEHENKVSALMIGVGAAFDYEAGNIERAPLWMQNHNLEWLYRLLQEPKRLFKRYLYTNIKYIWWNLWQ